MLSPCNQVTDQFGQLVSEHPHLMFYVPYATNAQLGLSMPQEHGGSYAPFILFEGEPWAFLIEASAHLKSVIGDFSKVATTISIVARIASYADQIWKQV